jgi:hypothetical protein
MVSHLYLVGEAVALKPRAGHFAKSDYVFTVRAHLPPLGDAPQYRIKSGSEPHERVVEESQLMRLAPVEESTDLHIKHNT